MFRGILLIMLIGLAVHLLTGSTVKQIAADFALFLAAGSFLLGVYVLYVSIWTAMHADGRVWERNRRANKLIKKLHRGTITDEEREVLTGYERAGVVKRPSGLAYRVDKDGNVSFLERMRLSERAYQDIWR